MGLWSSWFTEHCGPSCCPMPPRWCKLNTLFNWIDGQASHAVVSLSKARFCAVHDGPCRHGLLSRCWRAGSSASSLVDMGSGGGIPGRGDRGAEPCVFLKNNPLRFQTARQLLLFLLTFLHGGAVPSFQKPGNRNACSQNTRRTPHREVLTGSPRSLELGTSMTL